MRYLTSWLTSYTSFESLHSKFSYPWRNTSSVFFNVEVPAILNSAAERNDLTTARLKSTRLANSWNLAGKVLWRCLLAVNTLSPCFEVFRVKSEALCVLTVRLQQRSYTLHSLQPPNVNKLRLCSIALTIVLNISQACASLSAEIWGLIIVLKWRMAERRRISLRDHWSHFGLWCLKL